MTRAPWLALALLLLACGALAVGVSVGSTGFDSLRHALQDPVARQIVAEIAGRLGTRSPPPDRPVLVAP